MEIGLAPSQQAEGLRQRLLDAAEATQGRAVEALQAAAEDIRVRIDEGPGGLAHIRSGRLNESLHGEGLDAIEILDEKRMALTIGSSLKYANAQQRRFIRTEGPLVPISNPAVREIVEEQVLEPLRGEFD